MANLLTHLARGDTALSITMTAISSLAAVVTVPPSSPRGDHFDASVADDVSMLGVVARVFLITIVPLAIGHVVRGRATPRARRGSSRGQAIAFVVFLWS